MVHRGRWGEAWAPEAAAPWGAVLDFWFGPLSPEGEALPTFAQRWWIKDPAFDEALRRRWAPHYAALAAGDRGWVDSPMGRLAAILVLDQGGRNMFRGTPLMYALDPLALELALEGLDAEEDQALPRAARGFLYMPLMHAEELALQERCVTYFDRLAQERGGAEGGSSDYARQHRDIIARFGRFPHRNAILGRESSDEERAFLKTPGSSF